MKNAILCLLTFTFFTTAQTQNAQKAKTLLDEVSTKVKSYNNIEIEFKYSLTNLKEGINQDTRGDVTLQGDKYLLNMMGATRLFDGTKLYTISPEDEEVTISSIGTDEEDEITPSKMLTFYEKGYTYKWDIVQ
ncbi:MAG TPA: outer membrane lipoprotein carrier protein LolA, partial [Flavobacteriaceae bacterium]|nr:outer membrane lipoprotein carrier protein LolA [Flavobacteriaceae bacterium]